MIASAVYKTMNLSRNAYGLMRGLGQYVRDGEADQESWRSWLEMHCMTNGRSTEIMTAVMRRLSPPPARISAFTSLLGNFDATRIETITDDIRRNGYHVFDSEIPESICDEIATAATQMEAETELTAGGQPIRLKYDPLAPAAYKYVISEQEGFRIPAFQRIVGDPIFVNVSQAYLRATPAMLSAAVWWSAVKGGQASSEAAQLFHFDYDPAPIWLKFFVYLTDVDAGAGPHVFVRGSHQRRDPRAKEILKRGYVRLEDKEVASVYGHENIIEVTGRRGTVLVADTLGFHKGKAPQTSARCLAQLVFATPIFVPTRAAQLTIPAGADPSLLKTFSEYPWAFKRFRIAT